MFFFQTEQEFFREINFKNFFRRKKIMKLKSELFLKLYIKLKKRGLKKLEQKKESIKSLKKSNFKNISSVISFCVHMYFYLKINFEVSSLKKVKIHKMMPNNF